MLLAQTSLVLLTEPAECRAQYWSVTGWFLTAAEAGLAAAVLAIQTRAIVPQLWRSMQQSAAFAVPLVVGVFGLMGTGAGLTMAVIAYRKRHATRAARNQAYLAAVFTTLILYGIAACIYPLKYLPVRSLGWGLAKRVLPVHGVGHSPNIAAASSNIWVQTELMAISWGVVQATWSALVTEGKVPPLLASPASRQISILNVRLPVQKGLAVMAKGVRSFLLARMQVQLALSLGHQRAMGIRIAVEVALTAVSAVLSLLRKDPPKSKAQTTKHR
jgi:hypothetical protein